ncbi:hypothetical protein DV735_g5350, partial [Chaetothyriales sp. CBS 134920]
MYEAASLPHEAQPSLPPPPPPLPPGRLGPLQRFIAPLGLGRTPRQNEEDPGQRKESPALHTASSSIASYGALASQTATHRTGIPISALDTNEHKTHAVLAGKEILKTVRIQDGCVTEEFNLRTSILSYASTHGSSQPDAAARRREYLSCRDVRWSSKQFSHVIATAGQNGRIALYDVNVAGAGARTELAWIHDHTGQVNKLDFDVFVGYMMLSASTDKTVRMTDIRDTRAAKCTQKFVVRSGVRHVAWSPVEGNDFEFAVCADGGLVQHWDARNPRGPTLSIHAHERGCYSLDWHPGGRHVVSGGTDKYVRVWDLKGERRQKPVFSFRAPQAIRNVKWRPPSWSSDSAENGAWQTTQVATTYQLDDPRLHVWDLRRPMIPFREIDSFNRPASDFLWASKDVIWACGEEGVLTQNDINFAPQVHQMCPPSSLQSLPNGDCIFFSEERPHRRLSKGDDPSAAFLSLAPDGLSLGDEAHQPTDLDPEDRESVHNDSLLSTSFKRKVRSVPQRSASSAANLSHSASPQTPNPLNSVLQLNKVTKPGISTFGNDQAGFLGSIIGAAPEPGLVEFLAHYYSTPPSEVARKKRPDQILDGLTERFLNNADACAEASMHRMAQSWRMLESVIVPELQDWADSNRAVRKSEDLKIKERGEKERQKTKEKAESIHSFSKAPAGHAVAVAGSEVKPQKLVSHLLSAVTDSERGVLEHDSTSNMTTPLARPLKEPSSAPTIEPSSSDQVDSPDSLESLQPLPPSVLNSHATAAAAARALADTMGLSMTLAGHDEAESGISSSSQEEDADLMAAEKILERSPMINPQVHEEKRAVLLDYRVQARPIFSLDSRSSPPKYDQDSHRDSSESFPMFSTSGSSSQKPQLLGQSFDSQPPEPRSGSLQDQDHSTHVDSSDSFSSSGEHSLPREGDVQVHDFSADTSLSMETQPGAGTEHGSSQEQEAKRAEPTPELEASSPNHGAESMLNSYSQPSNASSSLDMHGYQSGHAPTQRKIHITNPALSISSLVDIAASQVTRSITELREQDKMDADGYVVADFWPIDLSRYETKLPFALSALPLACQTIAYDASSGIAAGQFAALLLLYLAPYFWHTDYRREVSVALPLPQPQDVADRLMRPDLAQRVLEGILIDHIEYLQRARLYDTAAALRRSCAELGFDRAQSQRAVKPQESSLTGNDEFAIARTSTTASGFAILAYKNGILNSGLSKPPSNLADMHKRRVEARESASPTESEYNRYTKKVEGAHCDEEEGYTRVFNQAFTGFPRDIGLNNNLSAPQPDYIEGLEMQEYRPGPIDDHISGAVLYKDDPCSLTLPLLAGEWKSRGKDMEEARLQSAYDGAALVYARNQALSYLGTADPPGHAEVTAFTTDGTNLNLFAHYATLSADGTLEYHQYPIKSTNLTDSHQAFRDGRRGLRNVQDHARKQSYAMRDHLRERWKRRRAGATTTVPSIAGRRSSTRRR